MKIDFHSHSNYSGDCVTDIKTYIKMASQRLDAIALTDHDSIKGWQAIKKLNPDFMVIPGIEVDTNLGDIIGVFINEQPTSRDPLEVIDQIKSQGGISIVPHPFDMHRGFKDIDTIVNKIDCIEVFNAAVTFNFENKKALKFAQENKKGMTAGSDAHSPHEIGKAYIESKASDIEGVCKEILTGEARIVGKKSSIFAHVHSTLAKTPLKRILYK